MEFKLAVVFNSLIMNLQDFYSLNGKIGNKLFTQTTAGCFNNQAQLYNSPVYSVLILSEFYRIIIEYCRILSDIYLKFYRIPIEYYRILSDIISFFCYICTMNGTVHTFLLEINWKLINRLSTIDRFDASWIAIEKRERQSLKHLKTIATVRSVGASTRIEGSVMTDAEVETLINKLSVSKLEDRDSQEVAGYFETLDTIAASYKDIGITESSLKNLHNILLKHSTKDKWHRGNYKQHSNAVEATNQGTKHIIFQTTEPGFATEDAMRKLLEWYHADTETHPVVKIALFVYDFVSIHPFQDGNGRMSRLIATLLLLKHKYSWIEYMSFEHEIENRKNEYYKELMQCQRQRPGEDVYPWVIFFLDCLNNIHQQLMEKLNFRGGMNKMAAREKNIYTFIENHPGCKSGQISIGLNIPLPTVKKTLIIMLTNKLIVKHGTGPGTNYSL